MTILHRDEELDITIELIDKPLLSEAIEPHSVLLHTTNCTDGWVDGFSAELAETVEHMAESHKDRLNKILALPGKYDIQYDQESDSQVLSIFTKLFPDDKINESMLIRATHVAIQDFFFECIQLVPNDIAVPNLILSPMLNREEFIGGWDETLKVIIHILTRLKIKHILWKVYTK